MWKVTLQLTHRQYTNSSLTSIQTHVPLGRVGDVLLYIYFYWKGIQYSKINVIRQKIKTIAWNHWRLFTIKFNNKNWSGMEREESI